MKLQFEERIDKRDSQIYSLTEENLRLKDAIRGKDDAIHALSITLLEKGEHNKKLTEKLSEVKNH